jgi:PAS domain S-box-containing protein
MAPVAGREVGSKDSDTGQPPAPDSELGRGNPGQQPSQGSVLGLGWPDLAALITAAFAGVDLIAWLARGPVLEALVPSGPVMKANTAIALLAVAGATIVARRSRGRRRFKLMSAALVAPALGLAAANAYEYVSGVSIGIDQLLVRDVTGSGLPGRMAISTTVLLLLVSIAILGLDLDWRGIRPSEWIVSAVLLLSVVALIGAAFGVGRLSGLAGASQMAASTGIAMILVSIAVIAARPEHAIFRTIAGPDAGARFVRRFGLVGIAVPFLLGALVLAGGRAGAFGADFAISLGTFVGMGMGLAGVVTAATYVRRAELAGVGRREAEVFKMIVETANEGIWTTDTMGRTLFMNDRMLEMLGYQASELIGKRALDLTPADIRELQSARMHDRLWGRSETYETAFTRKDGSILWALVGATPSLDADGKPSGSLALVSDMTARRAVEEALKLAQSQAVEASQMKSAFLANMSHEIRTPMNGVLGMTELLRNTPMTAEQAGYADAISRSGEALMTIINDILDFSKIEAGKLDIEAVDFDPRLVIEEAAEILASRAHQKGLELAVTINPAVPDRLRGDPVRLRQVLLNLISNAVKFTEHGQIFVHAQPSSGAEAKRRISFEVSDTGVGISESTQKRLFESFSQGDSSTTRKFGGTGLGLAISKQLVELMGGQIGVRSEPGNGSTFYFDCLFAEASGTQGSPAEVDRLPAVSNLLTPSTIAVLRAGQKPLLLVVDDSPVNQRVAAAMLGKLGYRVDVAVNGIEAVSATAVRQYAAVLMDCQLPNMNGYEATAAIRSREGTGPHTPIIAMTASAMKGDLERCIAAGMDAYLSKPVTMKTLGETIAHWIEPSPVPSATRIDSLKAVG